MSKWYNQIPQEDLKNYKTFMENNPGSPFTLTKKTDFLIIEIVQLERHNLKPFEDTFVYEMNSSMTFGKFRNCEFKDVYKISPNYIEWCILNAEGFIIAPTTFELLQRENTFVLSDVIKFSSEDDKGDLILDFSSFEYNDNGFLNSKNVAEQPFTFSKESITANANKILADTDLNLIVEGGNWNNKRFNNFSSQLQHRSNIKIVRSEKNKSH